MKERKARVPFPNVAFSLFLLRKGFDVLKRLPCLNIVIIIIIIIIIIQRLQLLEKFAPVPI